jgi:hypothetical protein
MLEKLNSEFNHCFPEHVIRYSCERNLFNVNVEDLPEGISNISKLQKQLNELVREETLRYDFKKESAIAF